MWGRGGEIDRSTGSRQRGAYAAFDDTVSVRSSREVPISLGDNGGEN